MLSPEQIETMRQIRDDAAAVYSSIRLLPCWTWKASPMSGALSLTEAGAEVLRLWEEREEAKAIATRLRAQLGLADDADPRRQTILLHANLETLADFERHGFVPGSGSLNQWLCGRLEALSEARLALAAELGKPEGAPNGWAKRGSDWVREGAGEAVLYADRVVAHPVGEPWMWHVWRADDRLHLGWSETARGAMIAADKAVG